MKRMILAALCLAPLLSCGGGRIALEPSLARFDAFEREIARAQSGSEAAGLFLAARAKRDEALELRGAGKGKEAAARLEEAVADARVAWTVAEAEAAEREAEQCRGLVERSTREWENAILALEHLERKLETAVPGVDRSYPVRAEREAPPLPAAIGDPPAGGEPFDPGRLRDAWNRWHEAARDRAIPAADLAIRFDEWLGRGGAKDRSGEERRAALHSAHRTVQELHARVRTGRARGDCSRAVAEADLLRASTEAIREATIDFQEAQADAMRAEARSRQDEMFEALRKLEGKYAQIRQEARGTIVSLADILFDFDKVTLKRDVMFNLVKIAAILNQFPEMDVVVEGHTDNIGTENYNQRLSERRAEAVQSFLAEQGVDPGRISTVGYGMSRPVAPNTTEEGRQKNRRVDLVIQEAP